MSKDLNEVKVTEFSTIESGVFFRMLSPNLKRPGMLVSIFEKDLPKALQTPEGDTHALFKVIDVDPKRERVTVEAIVHDVRDEAKVVPTQELLAGAWVVEMYLVDGRTKERTIGRVNDVGTFISGTRAQPRKRRGGRRH